MIIGLPKEIKDNHKEELATKRHKKHKTKKTLKGCAEIRSAVPFLLSYFSSVSVLCFLCLFVANSSCGFWWPGRRGELQGRRVWRGRRLPVRIRRLYFEGRGR